VVQAHHFQSDADAYSTANILEVWIPDSHGLGSSAEDLTDFLLDAFISTIRILVITNYAELKFRKVQYDVCMVIQDQYIKSVLITKILIQIFHW